MFWIGALSAFSVGFWLRPKLGTWAIPVSVTAGVLVVAVLQLLERLWTV